MTLLDQRTKAVDETLSVRDVVAAHLGGDPAVMPMLTEKLPFFQDINLQTALDVYTTAAGRSVQLMGVVVPSSLPFAVFNLSTLAFALSSSRTRFAGVQYESRESGVDEQMLCLKAGLLLIDGPEGPLAVNLRQRGTRAQGERHVDVLAPTIEAASAFLQELRRLMVEHSRFRGQFLRLGADALGNISVSFEAKPVVKREEVVLPEASLQAIEGHAIRIGRQAARLNAAERHLKRGLLLYGPPGTGKTHTVRYLASELPDATLLVLTGSGMAWLPFIKAIVADLTPAIVVLDDVDLIAEDRSLPGMAPRALLFSLLDAMDGMAEDADVLFVCTSNRADSIEKAIAARPGRIDQAVEIGLPDYACRKRLFSLYRKGMDCTFADLASVLDRTEGVTASFIKELLRRAFMRARAAGETTVTDVHLHESLDALLDADNPLTPALLGVSEESLLQRQKTRGTGTAWCGI
jgi:hypothetical protein